MLSPGDLPDEFRRLLGPNKRRGMVVPGLDVAANVRDQRLDGVERAAPHRLARQNAEPDFHEIQPGGSRRGEVKLHPGVRGEPRQDRGCRVRRGIVPRSRAGLGADSDGPARARRRGISTAVWRSMARADHVARGRLQHRAFSDSRSVQFLDRRADGPSVFQGAAPEPTRRMVSRTATSDTASIFSSVRSG